MKNILNLLWQVLLILSILSFSAEAAKDKKKGKDDGKSKCIYCEKYKKLKDWPLSERPEAYIYEEIKYPEGMFKNMEGKTSKSRKARSGQKVSIRFVKGKAQLNKNQGNMIRDMAYFEALYNEMLGDPEAKVETLESLKKGTEAMRMSLQISPKVKTSVAVLKFWSVGKLLKKAKLSKKQKKKAQKIEPEIAERAAVLAALKKQAALAKVNALRVASIEAQNGIDKVVFQTSIRGKLNVPYILHVFQKLFRFTSIVYAGDDVADMKSVSEAAGNSIEKAAEQLTSDAGKITENLEAATTALGTATSEVGSALDTTLVETAKAMDFVAESLAKGDVTAAVQTLSLIESVTDMALTSLPSPATLDMSKINFAEDFTPAEMVALSSIAGQMGAAKIVALQKTAGQMAAVDTAGFDSKRMMSTLDAVGMGIGSVMAEMANSGMVNMEVITGTDAFNMDNFDAASFASMNVVEMGMSPSMMVGALTALPVGAATAALETLTSGEGAADFAGMEAGMEGAIAATMAAKGMGSEMMAAMGTSMDITGMSGLAAGMEGVKGMEAMGETLGSTGLDTVAEALTTAFSSSETGIASSMSATVGLISGAISGKSAATTTAAQLGTAEGSVAVTMIEASPTAIEMPETVTESGMMMGAMVMAKSTMAGGLPGSMAPPKTMTAATTAVTDTAATGEVGLGNVMEGYAGGADMSMHMTAMTGISADNMSTLGMDTMMSSTGLTPGLVATMGSAGVAGMDVTSIISAEVAGLGSTAITDLTTSAAAGTMSTAVMGDMMETGLVNQGTMAAMGSTGVEGISSAMGITGGDAGLAAMTGGLTGMGISTETMDPTMADSMGLDPGGPGDGLGATVGYAGGADMSVNIGQVSSSMGTGTSAVSAIGTAADASAAATEAGTGIVGAAMGAAVSAQGAATAAMGAAAATSAVDPGATTGVGDVGAATGAAAEGAASAVTEAASAAVESVSSAVEAASTAVEAATSAVDPGATPGTQGEQQGYQAP